MMPVVAGAKSTINQILAYSLVLAPFAVLPAFLGMASMVYGVVAAGLGAGFVFYAIRLKREASDANAMALFKYSILYLFLIFLALGIDALLKSNNTPRVISWMVISLVIACLAIPIFFGVKDGFGASPTESLGRKASDIFIFIIMLLPLVGGIMILWFEKRHIKMKAQIWKGKRTKM